MRIAFLEYSALYVSLALLLLQRCFHTFLHRRRFSPTQQAVQYNPNKVLPVLRHCAYTS